MHRTESVELAFASIDLTSVNATIYKFRVSIEPGPRAGLPDFSRYMIPKPEKCTK
jgi:hypothetical protein